MLTKLTPRHRDAVRRLVANETPQEVAEALGVHVATIRNWAADPTFQAAICDLEFRIEEELIHDEDRQDALEILNESARDAAQLCVDTILDDDVDRGLRVKSAWDILDRTKGKPVQRNVNANVSITDLILAAHEEMKGKQKEVETAQSEEK